ncbi:MAG TPA: alpha-L-glutamate ligase, partial [Ktedonobacter sp.]|nr:alpha-L-glutamate ligase [Ktedonobacter sp.]
MQESKYPLADLYLLKSHAPQALDVAQDVEQRGGLVVNSWAASVACQDRLQMTEYMVKSNLPWPRTQSFDTLTELVTQSESGIQIPYPFILKSRYSHRGDLVEKVESRKQIEALAETWGQEPVIVQELVASDGWDIKV